MPALLGRRGKETGRWREEGDQLDKQAGPMGGRGGCSRGALMGYGSAGDAAAGVDDVAAGGQRCQRAEKVATGVLAKEQVCVLGAWEEGNWEPSGRQHWEPSGRQHWEAML